MTQNGVTDHIGRSQVAPYVLGLARLGHRIHVLSAEKEGRDDLVSTYEKLFHDVGVDWTRVSYRNKPPVLGQILTQIAMKRAAKRIVDGGSIKLLHCRSFPPALIAYALKRKRDVKYIFDFRDFYADGGLEKSRGLSRMAFRRLKHLEGGLIRSADKVVCLTNRARELLSDWYLQDDPEAAARFQVIPCCADFTHFDPEKVTPDDLERARTRARLRKGDYVLLYLGSLGPDYLLPQMMALFRQILAVTANARFLFVSNNGKDLVDAERQAQNVPANLIRFVSADRSDVPSFLALANLSVVFIRSDISKAGCSPAKLAELLAFNIPVIANTGVGDFDADLALHRNGSVVVKDFSDETLRSAVEKIIAYKSQHGTNIRESSRELDLEEGVNRYAAVYRELLRA